MPPRSKTETGDERRVGVEIELAGVGVEAIADCLVACFGGASRSLTRYEWRVENTQLGDFVLELDSDFFKRLERSDEAAAAPNNSELLQDIENFSSDLVAAAAEQFVPWEIVSPPLPLSRLENFNQLLHQLRERGAKGTRHAARFAFGLHLNPELPGLDVDTVLAYLRAYLCLYDWIWEREKIDLSRRLTPYIKHFRNSYIAQVVDVDYRPDLDTLIDDYLRANPTRNRSLDMLPLFAHLDEPRVRRVVDDPRVKSRPTLHYRLPNCDIDNPHWDLQSTWGNWLQVERLANDPQQLRQLCKDYSVELRRLTTRIDDNWLKYCEAWIETQPALDPSS